MLLPLREVLRKWGTVGKPSDEWGLGVPRGHSRYFKKQGYSPSLFSFLHLSICTWMGNSVQIRKEQATLTICFHLNLNPIWQHFSVNSSHKRRKVNDYPSCPSMQIWINLTWTIQHLSTLQVISTWWCMSGCFSKHTDLKAFLSFRESNDGPGPNRKFPLDNERKWP